MYVKILFRLLSVVSKFGPYLLFVTRILIRNVQGGICWSGTDQQKAGNF